MNDKQRNKLNMYVLVRDYLLASATITNKLVVFAALLASFMDYVIDIFAVSEQQERDNSGVTKTKKTLKSDLRKKIFSIGKRCIGYASGINDLTFLQLVSITKSKLDLMADADLVKKAEDFITNVTPRLTQLTGYGVTANDLEALLFLKDEFVAIYTVPTGNKESTAQLTTRLRLLYKLADAVLKRIDDQVGSLFETDAEFHDEYFRRRAIVQLAKRFRSFQMWVKDFETGLPMAKVHVVITSKTKNGTEFTKSVKRTGSKGGVAMNNMTAMEYDYEVSFGGKVTVRGSFFINDGMMTEMTVEMRNA
jgi:hypothetical protein